MSSVYYLWPDGDPVHEDEVSDSSLQGQGCSDDYCVLNVPEEIDDNPEWYYGMTHEELKDQYGQ